MCVKRHGYSTVLSMSHALEYDLNDEKFKFKHHVESIFSVSL